MVREDKDKSLKLAAASVSATLIVGLGGALIVRTPLGVVLIVTLEAVILIGTGLILRKLPSDKGH